MKQCQKCGKRHIELRKLRASNGALLVYHYCIIGQHIASQPARALPHKRCPPLDTIRLLDNYTKGAPRCSVRGCNAPAEGHHVDPRNRCGESGDQHPLCRQHHAAHHKAHGW